MDTARDESKARLGEELLYVLRSDLGALSVRGADRITWLNGLLTCDLLKRQAGWATYGLFTQKNGKILSDALIAEASEEELLIFVPKVRVEVLMAHLDRYLIMEDVEIADRTNVMAMAQWIGSVSGPVGQRPIGFALHDPLGMGGALVWSAEEGPASDPLLGIQAKDRPGTSLDLDALAKLYVERRVPLWGYDLDDTLYPQEAGLERSAVSFSKGCYLGQEVVCMLELRGQVRRKLVQLRADPGVKLVRGAELYVDLDGKRTLVGTVGSVAETPSGTLALAMVKRTASEPGTALHAEEATVVISALAGSPPSD